MKLTWKELPSEIVHRIFGFVHNKSASDTGSIFCCALVCKAWEIPARYVLYSNIELHVQPQLDCLANTVEKNQDVAQLVKAIEFNVDLSPTVSEYLNLERLLAHLPNLENFSTSFVRREHFASLLNVLRDHKLPRLKRIPSPTHYCPIADAAACVFLLQDRLEELRLDMDETNYEFDPFYEETIDGLYNNLHLFKNLNELYIYEKEFNCEIGLMEDITTRCKSLTKLTLHLADIDELSEPSPRTITCVNTYTPQPNIKYLYTIGNVFDFTFYLSYIIHKFPGLETLALLVYIDDKRKGLSDPTVISKVMNYLSNIKNIQWSSHFTFHSTSLFDAIESYMKSSINSEQQLEYINFIYNSQIDLQGGAFYPEKNNYVHIGMDIVFYRPKDYMLNDYLEHTRFLENYGSRYKSVRFAELIEVLPVIHDEQAKDFARGEFLIHALIYCPNLEILSLYACLLEKIDISSQDLLIEKFKLNSLHIEECTVHEDMLKQLSKNVSEIKSLKLSKNAYLFKDSDGTHQDTVNILAVMEFTKIGTLEINIDSSHYFENSYLYLSEVMQQDQSTCYYKCEISSRIFLPCSKQEFDQRIGLHSHEPRIFINFYDVEKLFITYDRHIIKFES